MGSVPYKVIVADSRLQGKSADKNDPLSDSLSYEMMADDYAALPDVMNIDSAFVIGWSDGGINGLLLGRKLIVTSFQNHTGRYRRRRDLIKYRLQVAGKALEPVTGNALFTPQIPVSSPSLY